MATLPPDTRAGGTPNPAGDMDQVVDCLSTITGVAPNGAAVTTQGTLNTLAGGTTNNRVLAGNGTNVTLRALTAADLPTLDALTAPAGNVSLNNHKITSLANGSAATDALAAGQVQLLQAATTAAGYTLINGTGTIISWTAPSDGLLHVFTVNAVQRVTSAETGGSVQITWNIPDGTASTTSVFAAGQSTGVNVFSQSKLIQAGSTVVVQQNTALTAGAAVAWAQLWAL